MTVSPAGILDTSVFIAQEINRPLGMLPARVTVSVVTIGELELGVLSAKDVASRARLASTLALARTVDPVPITEPIMTAWADLVTDCRRAGISRMVKLTDALIAATAVYLGLPVFTQDEDYDDIAKVHPRLLVVRV